MRRTLPIVACLVLLSASGLRAGVLSVPAGYTPDKSWPVIISFQDNPSKEQMKTVPYFLVHAGGKAAVLSTKVRTYLKNLAKRHNIDPFRIYGTGFSRGGHEVLAQAWQHPHWFAAIAPVCNDLRKEPKVFNVKYLLHTPTLLLHGKGDSFRRSGEKLFEHMKQAGCKVKFETYPGGHNPQLPFKKNVKMLTDFFDKHKLDPYPKQVVHLVSHKRYSRAFWVNSGLVKDGGGQQAVFKVKVTKGNRIEFTAGKEFAWLEFELNEKLVDMKKSVTVVSGGTEVFTGPPPPKLKIQLRDGKGYSQTKYRPLWEEILAIRKKAKAATSRPAKAKKPTTRPAKP